MLNVAVTCRPQGRSLLDFLVATGEAALRGNPPPSLLRAPEANWTVAAAEGAQPL